MCKSGFLFFAILLSHHLFSQENYVRIDTADSENEIIRKAANVIPGARQLRWQQLELTAFFHFGINTFTDKEWGSGKESPELFNPSSFDATQWVEIAIQTFNINFAELGLNDKYEIRDLWEHKVISKGKKCKGIVQSHETKMFRLAKVK